ncbi:protein-L-isoaspartate(D-aspartate) O-methyltransferase [Vineibacter terrae]|uniref:protein-L-isoaspartate(D-aspartate) O-methyltransferase n=1 Tax=Vineibacter terrae TaxID=2586908 RepID=UPI002E375027|nr:protein-L-isoaspartate(D-aspartate) O-methyltransferase [Vineibacter terrae]HEX2889536.1 protein-L-isoaspartate(D-aspartate) O-methyltransferase [Vineibacter terrae]
MSDPFTAQRHDMVEHQIAGMGIRDARVLAAMRKVPRHVFVPEWLQDAAYNDGPLPIGDGQTISQPYVVAHMAEALTLRDGDRVLEIGTGSGYAAAVLAEIAAEVFTVERLPTLAARARAVLATLGYANVHVVEGDGTLGWPAAAPYDAIAVAAGGPSVPPTLRAQLKPGGRLVMPVGHHTHGQSLIRVTRGDGTPDREEQLGLVSFVPLIGAEGWKDGTPRI